MRTIYLCLALMAPLAGHAQIYKWIDAQGHAHYTDNKDEAGQAQVAQLKVEAAAPAAPAGPHRKPDWQRQEEDFRRRQALQQAQAYTSKAPPPAERRQGYYSGTTPETDQERCRLARDIKRGVAVHVSGAPVDKYDRQTAERDILAFCH